jgi:hypothetical protein
MYVTAGATHEVSFEVRWYEMSPSFGTPPADFRGVGSWTEDNGTCAFIDEYAQSSGKLETQDF